MFEVRYYRDSWPYDYFLIGRFSTLEAASAGRKCSGDLVVDLKTGKLADGPWRWEWELNDPHAYVNHTTVVNRSCWKPR